ncbi:MAG: hypothetical protein ABID79_04850 [Elusimicrobiota bacterium]
MKILDCLNDLNILWFVIIVVAGLCLVTIAVVILLLEKTEQKPIDGEGFSERDKKFIAEVIEKKIAELVTRFDLFKESMDSAIHIIQTVLGRITTKIDDLDKSADSSLNQSQTQETESK